MKLNNKFEILFCHFYVTNTIISYIIKIFYDRNKAKRQCAVKVFQGDITQGDIT